MQAAFIYRKTPYGRDEVHSRTHQLSPRERATLIMIDGQRCLAELKRLSPVPNEVEHHLQTFLHAGLIAPFSHPAGAVSHSATSADDHRLRHAGVATEIITTAPAAFDEDWDRARRYITEVAQETLGAEAATFTGQLNKLNNAQELLNLAHHLRNTLHRLTNVKEAEQFWETLREVVPKT